MGDMWAIHVQETHQPRNEAVASPLEDPEEARECGLTDHDGKEPSFQHVCDEEPGCGFVEAMTLLEDEGLVDRQRKRRNARAQSQNAHKDERLSDLSKVSATLA